MITIRISEDAVNDLSQGYAFYEQQERGLGEYFATNLKADIEGLKITAGIHRQVYRDYHRLICRVFPYVVYYTFGGEIAQVWAVVDCRRDSHWIRKRLEG